MYTNSEIAEKIKERCHSKRDRAILRRRYIDGETYEVLSAEFGMSVAQIKRIVYKWIELIRE